MLGEDIFRIGAGSVNYFVEYDTQLSWIQDESLLAK
jgi:hypothetical protein